jgi:rubredoxin
MATIRCPLSGEQVEVERSPDDDVGDLWVCPGCKRDIALDEDRRLRHAPWKLVKCPVNEGASFVWTEEDGDYECDHCAGTIRVADGIAEHEGFALVECPAFFGETSLVFLGADEEYECDHCEATIYVSDGESRHEEVHEIACGQYPERLVVVPLEGDDSYECPHCGADIEVREDGAVHPPPRRPVKTLEKKPGSPMEEDRRTGAPAVASRPRRVFISYSTLDIEYVQNVLVQELCRAGHQPWYSATGIRGSDLWERTIRRELDGSEWFIVVMTPNAVQSEWVRTEVHWAIENRRGRIIPIMLETCSPWDIHMRLGNVQHILNPRGGGLDAVIALLNQEL